jgi:hypothetical protein
LRYALCPKCGDAVEARINTRPAIKCSHCDNEFEPTEIRIGLVTFDYAKSRWFSALVR